MTLYLYGIIEQAAVIGFGPIGFGEGEVKAIPRGGLAAVVGPGPAKDLHTITREELLKLLLSHQRTLELVMKKGVFVLPFKFGTTVRDEEEGLRILIGERNFLLDKMKRFRDCAEIDLIATWDVTEMLKELSETDPEIVSCKKEGVCDVRQQVFVGELLANALKRKAGQWREEIQQFLGVHAEAAADHGLLNDAMVVNCSFLIRREQEESFYGSLEKVNLAFREKLDFKCVGPLPPHSFATMTLRRFDPQKVTAAAHCLGLNGKAEAETVKRIYRELSRTCHPDTHPGLSPEKFDELNRAYELIADYCRDGPQSLERSAVENFTRLEICSQPEVQDHAA